MDMLWIKHEITKKFYPWSGLCKPSPQISEESLFSAVFYLGPFGGHG